MTKGFVLKPIIYVKVYGAAKVELSCAFGADCAVALIIGVLCCDPPSIQTDIQNKPMSYT